MQNVKNETFRMLSVNKKYNNRRKKNQKLSNNLLQWTFMQLFATNGSVKKIQKNLQMEREFTKQDVRQ